MTRDFEDRLRQSLQTRAQDVTPDPNMFGEVQSRIRRGRLMRWSLAGAGAVAMVAVAALVFPALNDRRVEFEPAPVATQPPSEPAEDVEVGPLPGPSGMVFSDGVSIYAMALDGESAHPLWEGDAAVHCPDGDCAGEPLITDVGLHESSSWSGIALSYRLSQNCGELTWGTAELGEGEPVRDGGGILTQGQCPTAAVFSPDGEHLAWASADDPTGEWSLHTVDWTDAGPGNEDAGFEVDLGNGVSDITLRDWVWTEDAADGAAGYLVAAVTTGDHRETYRIPIERQPGGALATSNGAAQPMGGEDGATPVAYADAGPAGDGTAHVAYTIELLVEGNGQAAELVRRTDGAKTGAVALPAELTNNTRPPFDPAQLWVNAMGDTVVYGNAAHAKAWSVTWDGETFGDPRLLDTTIVHADLFGGGGRPPAEDPAEETPAAGTTVEVHFTQEGGECGESVRPYPRPVEGPGVLRGALEHLLAGPSAEELASGAAQSVFSDATAGALNEVTIAENGVARIDFADFSDHIFSTACMTGAMFAQLEPTVRQFLTVKEVVYSFDGSIEDFYSYYQMESPPHRTDVPVAVTRMQERIREALFAWRDGDVRPLAQLIDRETFSCSFSDQNEDCIALWQQQEADGEDSLGPLEEMLWHEGEWAEPAKNPDAPIWVWPQEWMTDEEYLGPRTGIQRNGTWRYYQQGGD